MIPIIEQPEPISFDFAVRKKGLAWLALNQIDEATLQEFSPFAWLEAKRQGLL